MVIEIVTKEEYQKVVEELVSIRHEVRELREQIGITWIDIEDAMKLTGRSRSWFYHRTLRGTLPIAMMPRDEGSRRVKYSRADCIRYGREQGFLPPTMPGNNI